VEKDTTPKCKDLDGGKVDEDGDTCDVYNDNPSYCTKYDLSLHSGTMCCACGGGSTPQGTYEYKGCHKESFVMQKPGEDDIDNGEPLAPKVQCEKACLKRYPAPKYEVDYIAVGSEKGDCRCGLSDKDKVVPLTSLKTSCNDGPHYDLYRKPLPKYYLASEGSFTSQESSEREAFEDIAPEQSDCTYPAYCCGGNICKRALQSSCGGTTWLVAEHICKQDGLHICSKTELRSNKNLKCEDVMKDGPCRIHLDSPIWTSTESSYSKYTKNEMSKIDDSDAEFSIGDSFTYERNSYLFTKMFLGVLILGGLFTLYSHKTRKTENDSYYLVDEEI